MARLADRSARVKGRALKDPDPGLSRWAKQQREERRAKNTHRVFGARRYFRRSTMGRKRTQAVAPEADPPNIPCRWKLVLAP